MAKEKDQEFVEYIVKAIVDNPNDVKVDRTIDELGVLITLSLNPADMGKIIGKEGRTAKALRTLLRVLGAKNNARVNLKILEPEGSERPPRPEMPVEKPMDKPMEKPVKEDKKAQPEEESQTMPIEEEKATEIV